MVSGADFFSPERQPDAASREIRVWSTNWLAVEVFERCQLTVIGGLGASYQGISAGEFRDACDGMGIPLADRAELLDDVQFMGRKVASALNARAASK